MSRWINIRKRNRTNYAVLKVAPGYNPRNGHTWRHHMEQEVYYASFKFLLKKSTWKRHPAPFSKTERGIQRRQARLFHRSQKGFI